MRLACKQKTPKTDDQGVVSWGVEVINQNQEVVASYTVLTLVRRLPKTQPEEAPQPRRRRLRGDSEAWLNRHGIS